MNNPGPRLQQLTHRRDKVLAVLHPPRRRRDRKLAKLIPVPAPIAAI